MREKWPIWERANHGNCPFCWGASLHKPNQKCEERMEAHIKKEKGKNGKNRGNKKKDKK